MRLVLASASPTRLRVLRDSGFDPAVVVSGVDEDNVATPTEALVVELAQRKALAVAPRCPSSLVLGCDSMLDVDGTAYGKPKDEGEATEMWDRQSGRSATLMTGHCLIDTSGNRRRSAVARTVVHFGQPNERELSAYVASGEPLYAAGGFTIDGRGACFVEGIDGDPNNVLGVSLPLFRRLLNELEIPLTDLWRQPST